MTERTLITEADFSVKALNSIKRTFPNAVTLGELRQAISDDPKSVDYLGRNTYGEISKAFETVESDTAITANGFDYSLVDEDTAQYLRKATVRIANSYADIGAVLAEAQERLAKHGFGEENGVFKKWFTSLGMKKDTVYTFIRIHNFRNEMILRSSEFQTNGNALEIFDNLPKMLQSDISSPSAPAEAVNAVLSGDITTHKDYIALKKQLEEAKNKADIISNNYDRLSKLNTRHFEDYEKERKKNKDLEEERDKLLSELKEAREQPKNAVFTPEDVYDPTQSDAYKELEDKYQTLELAYRNMTLANMSEEEFRRRIVTANVEEHNRTEAALREQQKHSDALLRMRTEGMQEHIDKLEEQLRLNKVGKRHIITMEDDKWQTFLNNFLTAPKFSMWHSYFENAIDIEL